MPGFLATPSQAAKQNSFDLPTTKLSNVKRLFREFLEWSMGADSTFLGDIDVSWLGIDGFAGSTVTARSAYSSLTER